MEAMFQCDDVDLPPNMECLKNVDALLRCPICFEFLNITMMTKCSHNFCSLCIRKFFTYKLLCPVCNSPSTEQDLRNNRILDDLVHSFQSAREQLSRNSPPNQTINGLTRGKARQKGLSKEPSTHFFQKRVPLTSKSASLKGHLPIKEELVGVDQQDVNIEETNMEEMMDNSVFPSTSQIKACVKVECPVCTVGVSQQHINNHLDACLNRDKKKEGLRSAGRRKSMPKLLYTLITVPKLKKMLKECHLSAHGSREQLVRRHQEFTQIYNAQCDALQPKSAEEIAAEVENNERMKNQLSRNMKPTLVTNKNQSAEEIEERHSIYRKQHSSEFSRLIAQVRGHKVTSQPIQQEPDKSLEEASSKDGADTVLNVNSEEPERLTKPTLVSPSLSEVSVSSSVSDIFS